MTGPPPLAPGPPAQAPVGLEAPAGHPRFWALDGIRGVASLVVILTHVVVVRHSGPALWHETLAIEAGYCALATFFAMSAFLLYRPFLAARHGLAPPPRTRDYFLGRALRILPAYWVALTLLAVWPGIVHDEGPDPWALYLFLQVYSERWSQAGLGVAWSLCVEVVFYLLLPLLAMLLWRARGHRLSAQLTTLAVLSAASLSYLAVIGREPVTPAVFTWFAIGMGLAAWSVKLQKGGSAGAARFIARHPALAWVAAAVCVAAASLTIGTASFFVEHPQEHPLRRMGEHLFLAVAALLVLAPVVFAEGVTGRGVAALRSRPLTWLGTISLGMYLWHLSIAVVINRSDTLERLPLEFFVLLLVTTGGAIAFGTLSYCLIERPFLEIKRRRRALR